RQTSSRNIDNLFSRKLRRHLASPKNRNHLFYCSQPGSAVTKRLLAEPHWFEIGCPTSALYSACNFFCFCLGNSILRSFAGRQSDFTGFLAFADSAVQKPAGKVIRLRFDLLVVVGHASESSRLDAMQ